MGYDKSYTKSLPTWKDKWWEYDRHGNKLPRQSRGKAKTWKDQAYYQQNPKRAAVREAYEKGERDFTVLWGLAND